MSRPRSIVVGLLLVVLCTAGLVIRVFNVDAQQVTYQIVGWAWSETYGWISLSSTNCQQSGSNCGSGTSADYGVRVDGANKLSGYAWSSHVGWVCFEASCGAAATINTDGTLQGNAQILSLGSAGRLSFRGGSTQANFPAGTSGEQCYDCRTVCDPVKNADGVVIGQNCNLQCGTCFTKTCFADSLGSGVDTASACPLEHQQPQGVAGDDPVVGGSGLICSGTFSNCTVISAIPSTDGTPTAARTRCTTATNATCRQYGVNRIASDGSLAGWAWNGAGTPFIEGAGWVKFHGGGAQIVYPWLETGLGSIYVPRDRDVRQRIDTPAKNATYCIFARDVASFDSANCPVPVHDVDIGFPTTQSGVYRNALGRIDVTGLVQTIGSTNRNKYGQRVVELTGALSGSVTLGDQVYHAPGNLTVNAVTFENGINGQSGAGTIIVDGDLTIHGDATYAAAVLGNSRELASVAWIVKGDIIIDTTVTNVVGAFVAFGNGSVCEPTGDTQFPTYTPNHCGVFFSVTPGGASSQQLRVTGLVIAHAFDFQRTYADPLMGAESIIYDGRLIANPPPGLKGFTEGLPVIRDF